VSSYDRSTESSAALTEVRTVLSRAETALVELERERAWGSRPLPEWRLRGGDLGEHGDGMYHADPDIDDMIDALNETVKRLDKYRRTGKTRRR
jgi:hypothetical protein